MDPETVTTVVNTATAVEPIVLMIISAIRAHHNATNGQWPTPEQVQAALPADSAQLKNMWAAWTSAHPTA